VAEEPEMCHVGFAANGTVLIKRDSGEFLRPSDEDRCAPGKLMALSTSPTFSAGKSWRMVLKGTNILRFKVLLSPCPIFFSVPITSKRIPFNRIVLPTEGRPENSTRRASSPKITTGHFWLSSDWLSQRPSEIENALSSPGKRPQSPSGRHSCVIAHT
jgi:hypothetical protein